MEVIDLTTVEIPQVFKDFTLKQNSSVKDIENRFTFINSESFAQILNDLEKSIKGGLEECLRIEKLISKLMLLEAVLFNIYYIQDFILEENWMFTPAENEVSSSVQKTIVDRSSLDNLSTIIRRILHIKKELKRINETEQELEMA